ncbi:MAG: hypothetical protein J5J06_07375 [Phycisphaerae bacterium]|nr:hypothetical protein [Phycisphaerae bacterium]
MFQPMTLIVVIVLGLLLLGATAALRRACGPENDLSCPHCQASNRRGAHYCARCGELLRK